VQCTHGEGAAGSIKRLRAMGMAGSLWWDWGLQYFYDLSIYFLSFLAIFLDLTNPHADYSSLNVLIGLYLTSSSS